MKQYLSLAILWLLSLIGVYFYYIHYGIHGESKDSYLLYMIITAIFYGSYKVISGISMKSRSIVSGSGLVYAFLLQLLFACIFFFVLTGGTLGLGVALFLKILFFLGIVSVLWLNFYCIGNTILKYLDYVGIRENKIQILSSIGLGFTICMLGVFLLASVGLYSMYPVGIFFIVTAVLSYQSWIKIFQGWNIPLKEYHHNVSERATFLERYNSARIIDELHYIIITFLLSVNLVSVYRPFPIGWDDLGAYMNYPKLLSQAGEHISLGKMYMWELYTGLGFISGSQTLAFYLNSFSGIVAAIVVYISVSYFTSVHSKTQNRSFDLGLFSSMVILMMPMVIFQIAKDMKLDIGLLIISVIALSVFYYLSFQKKFKNLCGYLLVGIFIGIAFSIKITSLLLLLGVLAGLFYKKYSFYGLLSFILTFTGVFSVLGLWSMLNVVVPTDSSSMKIFGLGCILLGGCVFGIYVSGRKSWDIQGFFLQLLAILLGFIIAILPWGIKHIGELSGGGNISISGLISGKSNPLIINYENIYSAEEIQNIKSGISSGISNSGTTSNEDWGRYFGYENGVNNYLKLPWNLSFQTNQKGEFTDITYIFFIFIPALFLFLPFRREEYKYPIIISMFGTLLYFMPGLASIFITSLFSYIELPIGYMFLAALALLPICYMSWALDRTQKVNQFFLINLAFSTVYIGLWAVSAYGVVWYGIVMYFSLLMMINICIVSLEEENSEISKYAIYTVLFFTWAYLLQSSIPHGISNLKAAGYSQYKTGNFSEEVALMSYHPEYFPIISELNISDEGRKKILIEYRNNILSILDDTPHFDALAPQIQNIKDIGTLHQIIIQLSAFDFGDEKINLWMGNLRNDLYDDVIYPSESIKSSQSIYRVGTFLKYFISENTSRLLEDSLLTTYQNYIYDVDSDISLDRFKKLGLTYLLIDLNAATIDKDPAKNLTVRYENLLTFLVQPSVELIETDSVCLKFALDRYKLDNNIENYKLIGGVNYSNIYSGAAKKETCLKEILKTVSNEELLPIFPYLERYKTVLENNDIQLDDIDSSISGLGRMIPNGYKALFKIN